MADQKDSERQTKDALDKAVQKLNDAQPSADDVLDTQTERDVPEGEGTSDTSSDVADMPPAEEDATTVKAVDDIMKDDSDAVLREQDASVQSAVVMKQNAWERFRQWNSAWWANPRKRWGTIAAIVVVLGGLFAVPITRYNILGVALKAPVTVHVVDSKTGAPVSGATVELAGKTAETQADGVAAFRVNTGSGNLKVSKKYYTGSSAGKLVALSGNSFRAVLVATGRPVQVKLVNKITGKPVISATISASGAKAKTNKQGLADLVIPSGASTQSATVTNAGYNDTKVVLTADGGLAKNTFSVTPSGKLYFLSNLSGTIDVVKTNLDGTDRKTVLAGTGSEDRYNTSLLASRDWKYLALLSKRSGTNPSVYLIDTTNGDKLSTIDEGDASFTLVGWSGDRFVYKVHRNTVPDAQPHQEAIKSFDPTSGRSLLLDQTQGMGPDTSAGPGRYGGGYTKQQFGSIYLMGDQVVYVKNWVSNTFTMQPQSNFPQGYVGVSDLNGKKADLDSIGADGSNSKTIKSFGASTALPEGQSWYTLDMQAYLYEPDELYLSFYDQSTTTTNYYDYSDGKVTADQSLQSKIENYIYTTYVLSPSGAKTFWADSRDGKSNLMVGDQNAKNEKAIAALSTYNAYGWYTDDYLLVSKDSSELYIMGKDGGTPLKIAGYYKPSINYPGYGGGYGGL